MDIHFLPNSEYFIGIFYQLRIQCPAPKNSKPCYVKDLHRVQKGDYKPAYKKYQKPAENQLQDVPAELAEIVAICPELPGHIKATITQ